MKLVVGNNKPGKPIPRILNPIVMAGASVTIVLVCAFISMFALVLLVWAPFSVFGQTIKVQK